MTRSRHRTPTQRRAAVSHSASFFYSIEITILAITIMAYIIPIPDSPPAASHDVFLVPAAIACTPDAFPVAGTQIYWKYWHWPSLPSLYDIFLDGNMLVVILSFRFCYIQNGYESPSMMDVARRYSQAPWFLRVHGTIINNTYTTNDPELHSKVLKFPYNPRSPDPDFATIFTKAANVDLTFDSVPFCRIRPHTQIFATVCTQNFVTNSQQVLDWVGWHRGQGFERAVIYVNQANGARSMSSQLSNAIRNGSLSLVDWAWPQAYPFHDQPLAQTSCIYRAKGRSKWTGVNDLDEIFLADRGKTVKQVLEKYEVNASTIGSIACCNRWIATTGRLSEINQCAEKCDDPPHRQKNLVRTDNVDYFCNHRIMLGLPELRSDGLELVNGHYGSVRGEAHMVACDLVARFKAVTEQWARELA
jgi:hypothetical protein